MIAVTHAIATIPTSISTIRAADPEVRDLALTITKAYNVLHSFMKTSSASTLKFAAVSAVMMTLHLPQSRLWTRDDLTKVVGQIDSLQIPTELKQECKARLYPWLRLMSDPESPEPVREALVQGRLWAGDIDNVMRDEKGFNRTGFYRYVITPLIAEARVTGRIDEVLKSHKLETLRDGQLTGRSLEIGLAIFYGLLLGPIGARLDHGDDPGRIAHDLGFQNNKKAMVSVRELARWSPMARQLAINELSERGGSIPAKDTTMPSFKGPSFVRNIQGYLA
jgi:hypothetical protein